MIGARYLYFNHQCDFLKKLILIIGINLNCKYFQLINQSSGNRPQKGLAD